MSEVIRLQEYIDTIDNLVAIRLFPSILSVEGTARGVYNLLTAPVVVDEGLF